ncbi:hypothetical protein [Micromonospora sp. NPDC050495]|uniref:CHAT domain-containing protein n=1 Tax=Micromonospora sp. NPDC050495 TaxID=3154936 RepID=UPI00340298B7
MDTCLTVCDHCGAPEPEVVPVLRAAVSSAGAVDSWLRANPGAVLSTCRWVSTHDRALADRLHLRPAVRAALYVAMTDALTAGEESLDVVEFVARWGRPPRLPDGFSRHLAAGLDTSDPRVLDEAYRAVVARLRPVFGGEAGAGLHRMGWLYLLGDAAQAAFRAHDVPGSVALLDEAWQLIDELPRGNEFSVKAVGFLATNYASSVGHLPPRHAEWDLLLDTAADRLAVATAWLKGRAPSISVAALALRIGISQAQLWYVRTVNGRVGWITGEARRLELLDQAEATMWEYLPSSAPAYWSRNVADLPDSLKDTAVRLQTEKIGAAAVVSQDRSPDAAEVALRLGTLPHHRFAALIGIARGERNLARRVAHLEGLLRETRAGLYDRASAWQRETMRSRLTAACWDLAAKLEVAGRTTAAWFWRREGKAWSDRSSGRGRARRVNRRRGWAGTRAPLAEIDRIVEDEGVGAEATNGGVTSPGISRLGHNILTEQAPGLALTVMAMVRNGADEPELRQATVLVDGWHPPRRRARRRRLAPASCRTAAEFRRTLLEAAEEIAAGYAGYLRPELLNLLARQEALAPGERLEVAQEALAASLEAAQWGEAAAALRVILAIAVEAGDSGATRYAVHALCGIVQHAVTQSRGTADLIDLARQMTSISTRLATFLASVGHAELAFHAAHAGLGAINRICAENAELIEEFELAEQFHRRVTGAADELFAAMHRRLNSTAPQPIKTEPDAYQPAALLRCMPGPAAYVQLLGERHGGFWAVGCVVDGDTRRWWTVRLDVTVESLGALREAVWQSLRPKRGGPPRRTAALKRLHAEIVGPFERELGDARDVVVVPHQAFAGLPLHAARGGDGFLIERRRVTYLGGLTDPVRPATASGSALVGGWDPAIGAPEEARELEAELTALGFRVVRPKNATLGRRHYLDPEAQWDVVHVAAHGDYHPWPRSMASELRLSRTVGLTAGDWLRQGCRASFVFVNACNVGRNVPHAGDVNGFPLALRIRGNVAEVSALCPVDSVTAGPFARSFYRHWTGQDSLGAYHATCLDAIARAEPPSVWAPYVHTGVPVTLAPRLPARPRVAAGAAAGSRRRRAHGRHRRSR